MTTPQQLISFTKYAHGAAYFYSKCHSLQENKCDTSIGSKVKENYQNQSICQNGLQQQKNKDLPMKPKKE